MPGRADKSHGPAAPVSGIGYQLHVEEARRDHRAVEGQFRDDAFSLMHRRGTIDEK